MSEPGVTAENGEGDGVIGNADDQPKVSYDAFFRFRPIAFIESIQEQAGRYKTHQEQRAYYASTTQRWLIGLGVLVLAEIFILIPCALLYFMGGEQAAQWVMAIVAIVMALTTWLQWRAIGVANTELIRQNEIMIRQADQTDAMVEQMRLDNRAWLSVQNATLGDLAKGCNKVTCTLLIKNSGKTPGRIICGSFRHFPRPKDYPTDLIVHEFESEFSYEKQVFVVQPNEVMPMQTPTLGTLDDDTIERMRLGHDKLHILVRIRYRFIGGKVDEEKAFFTSVAAGPKMQRRPNYCAVHKEIGYG